MNNGISFKFNFETDDTPAACELMPVIIAKLKGLPQVTHASSFKSVEINLMKPAPGRKTVCLTIHFNDSVIREEAREESWAEAINTVFQHAEASHAHSMKLD